MVKMALKATKNKVSKEKDPPPPSLRDEYDKTLRLTCSFANASAPSNDRNICGVFSITSRASEIGLTTVLSPEAEPQLFVLPFIIQASIMKTIFKYTRQTQ